MNSDLFSKITVTPKKNMAKKNTTKKRLTKAEETHLFTGDNDTNFDAVCVGTHSSFKDTLGMQAMPYEEVVHPKHYNSLPNGIECWDVTEHFPANIAMSMKHLWRCGLKPGNDPVKDLNKAIEYLERQRKLLLGQTNKM